MLISSSTGMNHWLDWALVLVIELEAKIQSNPIQRLRHSGQNCEAAWKHKYVIN